MSHTDIFFDSLKRNLDVLLKNPEFDNEASRHDKLIFPILNNEFSLGWNQDDIWAQKTILVPNELKDEYTFSGGIPKSKRPDLVIKPFSYSEYATIVEEKSHQKSIENLKGYNNQLIDYLGLFKCSWGILTDGEKWIIKKGFEDHMVFNNLNELRKNLRDFKEVLSKDKMIERYKNNKSFDLIYYRPHTTLISSHAFKLIDKRLPVNFNREKLIEEMASFFIAFLDTDYTFEYKLPEISSGTWTHSFTWTGALNYIIEIVLILSKEEKCKLINLTRYTAQRNKEISKIISKSLFGKFDENEQFKETIMSAYLYNSEKFGYAPSFDFIKECYEDKIDLFYITGA